MVFDEEIGVVIDAYRVDFDRSRSYTCTVQAIRTEPYRTRTSILVSVRNDCSLSIRIEFFSLKPLMRIYETDFVVYFRPFARRIARDK